MFLFTSIYFALIISDYMKAFVWGGKPIFLQSGRIKNCRRINFLFFKLTKIGKRIIIPKNWKFYIQMFFSFLSFLNINFISLN